MTASGARGLPKQALDWEFLKEIHWYWFLYVHSETPNTLTGLASFDFNGFSLFAEARRRNRNANHNMLTAGKIAPQIVCYYECCLMSHISSTILLVEQVSGRPFDHLTSGSHDMVQQLRGLIARRQGCFSQGAQWRFLSRLDRLDEQWPKAWYTIRHGHLLTAVEPIQKNSCKCVNM